MAETTSPSGSMSAEELEQARAALRRRRGAGGTPGGVGTFFVGFLMSVVGGYLILNQVHVVSSSGGLFGWLGIGRVGGFGLTMLPFLIGTGLLFANSKSLIGRLVTIAGILMILASILMNMSIYWQSTSLYNTLVMFVLFAGGIGLMFRSFREYPE